MREEKPNKKLLLAAPTAVIQEEWLRSFRRAKGDIAELEGFEARVGRAHGLARGGGLRSLEGMLREDRQSPIGSPNESILVCVL